MTRASEIFKRLYREHIPGQANKDWLTFSVDIETDKQSQVQFHPGRGSDQTVPFFYTPSNLSELQSCKSIFSTNVSEIFISK